ncbi:ABC transporter ATP-binding protein [Paraclostridium sordellii]|uniref:ABC transporter ATP-binding protein n=1 Tax=Paraclostridium sordellii TaxID=1505 RepID=UPI001899B993|nr:ATP-binding cassette domain-containing protein [Paeniclostridium sordellii]
MIIQIKNFTKKIKKNTILHNINLEFKSGSIYGIVGRNGSGKSILLKSICGLATISDGQIIIDNKIIGKDIEIHPDIGAVLDNSGFLLNLSGFKNLKLLSSINNKATIQDITNSMNLVGLDPEDKKPYKSYSLGMKQKLAIAQALMDSPEILVLDEPFNGLDRHSVENIIKLLIKLKAENKLIIICSHIESDLNLLCDNIYELEDGKIIR